ARRANRLPLRAPLVETTRPPVPSRRDGGLSPDASREAVAGGAAARGSAQLADVGEMAGERCGGGHRRTEEMRAAAGTLTALEVAVRGRGAALARREDVRVHAEAHRAACLAPLEAGGGEDAVETLFLGLLLDLGRAGDDHRAHP